MNWRKVSNYCIEAEGYKVARTIHGDIELYGVSYQGEQLSFHQTSAEAKKAAEKHQGGKV